VTFSSVAMCRRVRWWSMPDLPVRPWMGHYDAVARDAHNG
jgi:hypothetical protein